jgi:hypothetical protein
MEKICNSSFVLAEKIMLSYNFHDDPERMGRIENADT